MPLETSTQDTEVPSPTVKMSFLLVLTSVRVNMEDHSQQSRWKMLKHFYDFVTYRPRDHFIKELIHISWNRIKTMKECYMYMYKERFLTHTIGYCAIVLLIPLHKLIIYPATQKCFPSIKIIMPNISTRHSYTNNKHYHRISV